MNTYDTLSNYEKPIIVDNRNFRRDIPGIDEYFDAVERELVGLPKVNGIVVNPKYVDNTCCPICKSTDTKQLFIKYGFIFCECCICSHVFVRNRLKENIVLEKYSSSDINKAQRNKIRRSNQHQNYWSRVYWKYLSYIQSVKLPNINLLDIGSGTGDFLRYCLENSEFIVHGLDYCEDVYEEMTKLIGLDRYYHNQKLEDIDFQDKKFGLITLWGVLEHLYDPVSLMQKCHDILGPNGHMIILIPNIYSRAFKIFGIKTPTLNPAEHIQFYTEKSVDFLCKITGFKISSMFQELPVIDLMYPYIDYNDHLIEDILNNGESYYYIYIFKKDDTPSWNK